MAPINSVTLEVAEPRGCSTSCWSQVVHKVRDVWLPERLTGAKNRGVIDRGWDVCGSDIWRRSLLLCILIMTNT
jgi:hypothetical protein